MVTVYGVRACQKTRKSITLLKENSIEYKFVDLKKHPLNREELMNITDQLSLQNVVNSKGPTFRRLGLRGQNLSDDALFDWLLKEQGMINRPLIKKNSRYWIGFDVQGILEFVK